MGIYENIKKAAEMRGFSISMLEQELSLPRSSIAKYNSHVPSADKIANIARFLDVPMEQLMTAEATYYISPETAQKAQELFDNPDLRMLFDAAKDSRPEDLQMAAEMLKRFKGTNPDG